MSRNSKARRKARKARSKRRVIATPTTPWGSGQPLTPEERARVLSRYSEMRCRGFRFGFIFPFGWVKAGDPVELHEAARQKLTADSADKAPN